VLSLDARLRPLKGEVGFSRWQQQRASTGVHTQTVWDDRAGSRALSRGEVVLQAAPTTPPPPLRNATRDACSPYSRPSDPA